MLKSLLEEFHNKLNAQVKIGVEIEFYCTKKFSISKISQILGIEDIEKENGENQYELRIGPSTKLKELIEQVEQLQLTLKKHPDFHHSPKPYADQPSNGIHIHINLLDIRSNENLYKKNNGQEHQILLYSIGGLLETLEQSLQYFAPTKESYERYRGGMNNPTKICWGGNNRTTAIRIPNHEEGDRRIEHRVPASNCDFKKTIYAILTGILHGIDKKIFPSEKVHGNAFLEIYEYKKIPEFKG